MIKTANLTGSVSRKAGGLFESVRRLVQSLAETGMEVRVFGTEDEFTSTDLGAWRPVAVRTFRGRGPRGFGYSSGFREALAEFEPDVVHTHGLWLYPSVATSAYCRRRRVPYVVSPHGMLDVWAMERSSWKKAAARMLYEDRHLGGAQVLRALCEAEGRAMRAAGLRNPIAIIPNGIDLPEGRRTKCEGRGEKGEGRREKGEVRSAKDEGLLMSSPARVLLYLGRIHPKKGLVELLKGWKEARKSGADWVLVIAGWDQEGHETVLKRLATELGIRWAEAGAQNGGCASKDAAGCSVVFLGPRFGAEKEACLRTCDGFVLPSLSEGVPMSVLEAWAHKKPVLMTKECHLPEGVAAGAAIEMEPEAKSIRAGLEVLFEMGERERRAMGEAGYGLVSRRYNWERVAAEMKGLYECMLGGGSKPRCIADF